MRHMYDGINSDAATIHRMFPAAVMVAGYIDGKYKWTSADWDLFPHAVKVEIAVDPRTNAGHVIDREAGNATPGQAAEWVRMRKASGLWRPTVYVSLDNIPAVRQATGTLKLTVDYDIWAADYDNSIAQVYRGSVATQYHTTAGYDESAVYDNLWPHDRKPGTLTGLRVTRNWPAKPGAGQLGAAQVAWDAYPGARAYRVYMQIKGGPFTVSRTFANLGGLPPGEHEVLITPDNGKGASVRFKIT